MVEKRFIRDLTDEDRMRCEFKTQKGVVKNFLIQYEILIGKKWIPIVRYDTGHQQMHRDLLKPDGNVLKKWFYLGFDQGLTFAYEDISLNWEKYKQRYLEGKEVKND